MMWLDGRSDGWTTTMMMKGYNGSDDALVSYLQLCA